MAKLHFAPYHLQILSNTVWRDKNKLVEEEGDVPYPAQNRPSPSK